MAGNHTFRGYGERWPYSTGKGQEFDQKNAGDRQWSIEVEADDLSDALDKVELYRTGIESSPHVWMAPIHKIEQVRS
jgi:hypothetical protein